ncbi:MAG: hypothetical protein SVX28_02830 [Pseudomonadota bacterium]|nr:hypothetical protein [Pseudomonadota bacterium]
METDLSQVTAEVAMDAFGEDITFDGQPARGIVSTELVELGNYEQVVECRTTVSVLVSEVPEIAKGQMVITRGKAQQVDQLMAVKDNPDVMAKVVLR